MIDPTVSPAALLRADARDVARLAPELPVFTILDAVLMCANRNHHITEILHNELARRKVAAEIHTPVTVVIPGFDQATPDQLRGGLLAAGWTIKTLAVRIGRNETTVRNVLHKHTTSAYVECAIMRAIAGELQERK